MKIKLKGTHRCKKLQWWKTCLFNDESWLSLYYWVSIRHNFKVFWFLSFDSCSFSSDIVEVSLISFQEDKIARLEIEGSKVWKGWAGHKGSKYFWFLSFQYCRPEEMPSIKYQGSENNISELWNFGTWEVCAFLFGQQFQRCVNSEFSKLSHYKSLRSKYTT